MDEAPVGAELKGVCTFCPGDVVDKIVHRNIGQDGLAGESLSIVETTEVYEILAIEAAGSNALTDEGVAEIVDEVIPNQRSVSDRNSLAVVG